MTIPTKPTPLPSCGKPRCKEAMPYNAANGAVEQSVAALSTTNGALSLQYYNLYESGGSPDDLNYGVGYNWSCGQFASSSVDSNGNVRIMFSPDGCRDQYSSSGNGTSYFEEVSTDTYEPVFGCLSTLTKLTNGNLRMVDPNGVVSEFDTSSGLILSQKSPGGETIEYTHSTSGPDRIVEMVRTVSYGVGQETVESRLFEYDSNDNVQYVTLRRATSSTSPSWVNIRRVELAYYTTSKTSEGTTGDLKLFKSQIPDPFNASNWIDEEVTMFRYYTFRERDGFVHGLKYVLSPEGYEKLTDPETATNAQLAPYASAYYEYSIDRCVKKVEVQGGDVTDDVTVTENTGLTSFTYDNWYRKVVIDMPDGLKKTVYSNHVGQDILVDDEDGSDNWITYYKYNSDGRLEETVNPSAIDMSGTPYNDSNDDLNVQIKSSAGLINVNTYVTATGSTDATGFLETQGVKQGSSGTAITVDKTEYTHRTIGSGADATAIFPVSKTIAYRGTTGTGDPAETTYSYTWHSGTVQADKITTNLPDVPVAENGVNYPQSNTTAAEFDTQGRMTKSTDANGNDTTYQHDEATGAVTQMVRDDGELDLTTDMEVDDLGRTTESLGPEHNTDGQTVRTATWNVYKDEDHETWSAKGFKTGTTYTLVNPVNIIKRDHGGRVVDAIQATRGSGVEDSGKLSASDTFVQSSWTRWTKTVYGDDGRMESTRVYHTIPSSGEGTATANYDETEYGYDSMGRRNRVKTQAGTITRTVYDVRGLVVSTWVGTNDLSATDGDPSGGGAPGNNMKQLVLNEYDDGQDGGDGNLTKATRSVDGTSPNDRISEWEYDWRDRLTTSIVDDGTNEFHAINTLDNLGRTTVSETKRDDTSSMVLIAKSETKYDTRGRVYQSLTYGVSDAGVAGNSLESNSWFDANGNVIKSQSPGSQAFSKTTYDAINRATASYFGYYAGTGSDDPETLVDNVIFTETESTYDDASNVTFAKSKERFDNATGTGTLNGPSGSQPKSRDSYVAVWYDEIGRGTTNANYGTNNGTVPPRPNSAPASSDTVLVSTSVYNADGELEDSTDAAGKKDRKEYDDAGRITKITKNHGGSETEVTRTEYDLGRMSKQIAENSTTGNQVTTYTYAVTTTASEISSNDLLSKMTYPDSEEVVYTYNRQGERSDMTDQNDSVHAYQYDKLGRMTEDAVTLAGGSAVDNGVLRIKTTYDNRLRVDKVTSYDAATGGNITSEVQREYNDFNQMVTETQQHGSAVGVGTPEVQYAFENGSSNDIRPTSMTYPDGRVVNYDYGTMGGDNDELSRIQKLKIGTTEIVDYDYLGSGRVIKLSYVEPTTSVDYTLGAGSGSTPYDGLDRFGRVATLKWEQGATVHVDRDYTYDRVGNRFTQIENTTNGQNFSEILVYDDLHRPMEYDRGQYNSGSSSISSQTLTQDWTLDQTGNWSNFQQGVSGVLNQSRTLNTVNELTNMTETFGTAWPTPSHDVNGNLTSMPQPDDLSSSFDATWDAWNRLVEIKDGSNTVAVYEYDGLGRRIIKKTYNAGTLDESRHCYYSSNAQILEERIDSDTDPHKQFLWGLRFIDDLVLRDTDTTGNGTLDQRSYALHDPRFCVVALTDETGATQERYAYDAYGRSEVLTPAFASRTQSNFDWEFRYTGRRLDLETSIYYFRARYYHAELGRFISRDPLGYVDGMSLYRGYFVPNGVDPSGYAKDREVCCTFGPRKGLDGTIYSTWMTCPGVWTAKKCCQERLGYSTSQRLLGAHDRPCNDGTTEVDNKDPCEGEAWLREAEKLDCMVLCMKCIGGGNGSKAARTGVYLAAGGYRQLKIRPAGEGAKASTSYLTKIAQKSAKLPPGHLSNRGMRPWPGFKDPGSFVRNTRWLGRVSAWLIVVEGIHSYANLAACSYVCGDKEFSW